MLAERSVEYAALRARDTTRNTASNALATYLQTENERDHIRLLLETNAEKREKILKRIKEREKSLSRMICVYEIR